MSTAQRSHGPGPGADADRTLADRLDARIPGNISEVGVDSARKIAASGIPGLLLEADGGWVVGSHLARLLLQRMRSAHQGKREA